VDATLLTIEEAARYLGVSKLTLYGWVSQGKITYIKVGRFVKFRKLHLDTWIDTHTVKERKGGNRGTDQAARYYLSPWC
jgi:excisionase family DNA binding protein